MAEPAGGPVCRLSGGRHRYCRAMALDGAALELPRVGER
jgi:hypothetical protein